MIDLQGVYKTYKKNMKNKNFVRTTNYTRAFEKKKVQDNIILYESFHGKGMTDSPFAMFKYLYNNQEYNHFKHVWVLNSYEDNEYYQRYKNKKNIKFIKTHSKEYFEYLSSAKYLINSVSFPPYFIKKDEQIYINTWHGTPLKTLGKDMEGSVSQHSNVQRNFLQSDFILSPNRFTTDKITDAHNLEGIYNGEILENGYPRIDGTINGSPFIKNILNQSYNFDDKKKIILYAPTWRGVGNGITDTIDTIINHINELSANLSAGDTQLFLKVHPLAYTHIKDNIELDINLIPNWMDTNEILGYVDILITDYSSLFFDFLVTNKPILFFMYDKNEYLADRGVYMDLDNLPGPICYTVNDLLDNITNIENTELIYKVAYKEFKDQFVYLENGNVTKTYIDYIFNKNSEDINFVSKKDNKKNILVYAGAFQNNGITTSIINLSNNLDYKRYNLIIIDKKNGNKTFEKNIKRLSPNVKVLYREGAINLTYKEWIIYNKFFRTSTMNDVEAHKKIASRELQRLLGNIVIDITIDFSGYVPFWSYLFAMNKKVTEKLIYQHNDMISEFNKVINGKKVHEKKLDKVFALYKYFNKIISVGKQTKELNQQNLKEYVSSDKFYYVPNTLDLDALFRHRESPLMNQIEINNKKYMIVNFEDEYGIVKLKAIDNVEKDKVNFINIGRLSPEKDHSKLLRSFEKVLKKTNIPLKLYIVGSGSMDHKLKKEAEVLGIENYVVFTGQIDTAYELLDKCDCFVFSSNHEGQPMTLLESLSLDKQVIATDIPGNRSVLGDEFGHIVSNDEFSLAQGMIDFINKEIPKSNPFNSEKYNEEAMAKFYDVL